MTTADMNTIRKAITDATLAVQDYAQAHGIRQTHIWARSWTHVRVDVPNSIPPAEIGLYVDTYRITAEHAAALLASFAKGG